MECAHTRVATSFQLFIFLWTNVNEIIIMVYLLLKKIWNMMQKNILLFINFVQNCICDERIYIYDLEKEKKKNGVSIKVWKSRNIYIAVTGWLVHSLRVWKYTYCGKHSKWETKTFFIIQYKSKLRLHEYGNWKM